ncbi:MAG: fumarate hydratase [Archaeoglobus sp.]|nr:fumarate hydratase [Archaeoglobus sp.]
MAAKLIEEVATKLFREAATTLPEDVIKKLEEARRKEINPIARAHLESMIKSTEIAKMKSIPLCQDTGIPYFFIKKGLGIKIEGNLEMAISNAVIKVTKELPLRENVIHPLTKVNSGTNTGWGIPHIHYEVEHSSDFIEIIAVPRGFGSEAKSSLVWITTSQDIPEAITRCVLDQVVAAGGDPCPPTIIGVGVGGFADTALTLAKKALFRDPIGSHNPDPLVMELEDRIFKAVNSTGIGPMGTGGETTTLAVHVEISGSHTAVVPVGITFQCWAARYSKAIIYRNGEVRYLTHPKLGEE